MIFKRNILVLVLSASAIALTACGGQGQSTADSQPPEQGMTANSSEELLAAEGSLHMVEADSAPNPLQEHLQARVQVDPTQPTKSKNYTSSASDSPVGEEVHFRVLRLESEVAGLQSDFKKLLPPLSNLIVSDQKLDQAIGQIEDRQQKAALPERKPLAVSDQAPPIAQAAVPTAVPPPAPMKAPVPPPLPRMAESAAPQPETIPGPGPQKPMMVAQDRTPENARQEQNVQTAAVTPDGQFADISDRTASYNDQAQVQPRAQQAAQPASSKMAAMASADARPAPANVPGGVVISNVRTGEHPGKTRMVFDVSGPSDFKFDVDNEEKLLLINVASAAWDGPVHEDFKGSPLVSGYTAQAGQNQGTSIAIDLKKPVRVQYSTAMKPNEVYGHRIVLDIVPE